MCRNPKKCTNISNNLEIFRNQNFSNKVNKVPQLNDGQYSTKFKYNIPKNEIIIHFTSGIYIRQQN